VISSIAEVTDIHIVEGWLSFPRFKSVVEESDLTACACALNGRPRYWTGILDRRKAGLFEDGGRPPFYNRGRIMCEVLLLL